MRTFMLRVLALAVAASGVAALAVLFVVLFTSCGPPACSTQNCTGCCSNDQCMGGTTSDFCGKGGITCNHCNGTTETCIVEAGTTPPGAWLYCGSP